MNGPEPKLSDCGCCEGVESQTPTLIENPPGLGAVAWRIGTHSEFKQSMQARLTQKDLRDLKTRRDDDPTIGLLDAWAVVLDVLTFYQERTANEGYLRTATERRSLLELARSIGYELRPGVAASTYLAFTTETTPGTPRQAIIEVGLKAQSVPEQGEQAQTFETVEEIIAKPEWNQLRPRMTQAQTLEIGDESGNQTLRYTAGGSEVANLYFQGTSTGLAPGDFLLITTKFGVVAPKRVLRVTVENESKRTRAEIETTGAGSDPLPEPTVSTGFDPPIFSPGDPAVELNETNIQGKILQKRWREGDLQVFLKLNYWNADDLMQFIAKRGVTSGQAVFAFRERCGFFGHNAPPFGSLRNRHDGTLFKDDWDTNGWDIWKPYPNTMNFQATPAPAPPSSAGSTAVAPGFSKTTVVHQRVGSGSFNWSGGNVFLERTIPSVVRNSWALLRTPSLQKVYWVRNITESSLVAFAMSGKATGLALQNPDQTAVNTSTDAFQVRNTTAFVKSEPLDLAELPVPDVIMAGTSALTLNRMVLGLCPGQLVMLSGEEKNAPGVMRQELLELEELIHYQGLTTLLFHEQGTKGGLQYSYIRNTVTLNANVARATHGETKRELLGSGDAAQAFQKFVLKQGPLTYVSAPTPNGIESTLQMRINDVLWDEAPGFYKEPPQQRIFVTRRNDEGKTTVQFGDGLNGARLPSGVQNVTALYRVGLGLGGMLKAGQISLLLTRPLGVKEVVNPLPASGAADPEARDQARENAPFTVLTLDRIVSLQDFEDFARAYPGIGKAQAIWLWNGESKIIHITIAGAGGEPVPANSILYQNLKLSIQAARDPGYRVQIDSFEPLTFNIAAKLLLTKGYLAEKVKSAVAEAVGAAFSFERRAFGQAVTESEVLAIIQNIEGVEAVDLDKLYISSNTASLQDRLPAHTAHWNRAHNVILAAEQLLVNPREIQLTEMKL